MTYSIALRPSGRPGLGTIPTTNTTDVRQYTVGSGVTDPYIDAALEVHGISPDASPRVPAAVRSVLESTGAKVQAAKWGTTAEGTAGKIYVEWKPDKTYNAVDYANIAQRLVQAAAEQFTAGSRIVMPRYRIYRVWPLATLYVYPTGEAVPASAPELAKSTLPGDMPAPSGDTSLNLEQQVGGLNTWQVGAIAVGGVAVLGIGYFWWKRHMRPNRRARRRSMRRNGRGLRSNRAGHGISWGRSHKDGTVHGRDGRGHSYEIDTTGCYSLYVDGHHVMQFPSLDAAMRAAEKRTVLTNSSRQYEYRVIASGRGFHEPEHVPSLEIGQRVASRWSLEGAKNVRLQRRSTYTGAVQTWQTIESISQNPSKPGKHGTLHEFKVRWRDAWDDMAPTEFQRVWAYNRDHAIEKVIEDAQSHGWDEITILKAERA